MVRRPAARRLALAAVLTAAMGPGVQAQSRIEGQEVKGDASRSAHDGWSQAPVPREESTGKDAPGPGGASMSHKPGSPNAGRTVEPNGGEDPQMPLEHRAPGPSGHNPASPSR